MDPTPCVHNLVTDFQPDHFQCFHDSLTNLTNGATVFKFRHEVNDKIKIKCQYGNSYPRLDIVFYDKVTSEVLIKASRNAASEQMNRYSLSLEYERYVHI